MSQPPEISCNCLSCVGSDQEFPKVTKFFRITEWILPLLHAIPVWCFVDKSHSRNSFSQLRNKRPHFNQNLRTKRAELNCRWTKLGFS